MTPSDTYSALPCELFTAESLARMERQIIEHQGIPGIDLMERAGLAAFKAIETKRPGARTLSAVTGSGNNGGDAFIVARLAHQKGFDVRVYPVAPTEHLKGDALLAFERFKEAGGETLPFIPEDFEATEILIDGLFGTGLSRTIESPYREVIEAINRYRARGDHHTSRERLVVALDLPSGIAADTGQVLGIAVEADLTVTFLGLKQGLFTGEAPAFAGDIVWDDLGMDPRIKESITPSATLLPEITALPPRRRNTHKGHFGHVLVIGGDLGYLGAARLAAEAAARIGAGLVSIASRPEHASLMALMRPELMGHGVLNPADLDPLLAKATVIAVGPGLGRSPWAHALFQKVVESPLPLVIDADALHWLGKTTGRREDWVLTPHPGEAGQLLACSSQTIQKNRFGAIEALLERFGGTVVLKGAGTLVQTKGQRATLCRRGNPGMATGGMGDVLTGVIAGLMAQGMLPSGAARHGVVLHATAGDLAARDGERGLLAGDLMPFLRQQVNP